MPPIAQTRRVLARLSVSVSTDLAGNGSLGEDGASVSDGGFLVARYLTASRSRLH